MATFFLLFSVIFLAGISIAVASYYLLKNRRTYVDRDDRLRRNALDRGQQPRGVA